ncbi:MAG: glycosyl transferase [Erysipelotrichaceae bacterium]|nr:glycosyl transferase [Erysipelotrichaceae bacterium]
MIPKIIHYCWFGDKPKPDLLINCMNSWKEKCPDYEIVEWNQNNFDIEKHPFIKEAYNAKQYAFAVDVIRLMIIYYYGGFYLDIDVELLKSLDDLCQYDCFFSFENEMYINGGLGFGAEKNHPYIKHLIDMYDELSVYKNGKVNISSLVSPGLTTKGLFESNDELIADGSISQIIDNCIFMSINDYRARAIHHYANTWGDNSESSKRKRSKLSLYIQSTIKRPKYYRYFGRKNGIVKKVYSFIAYDLFDCGIWYFVKRLLKKFIK